MRHLLSVLLFAASSVPTWAQGSGDLLVTSRFTDAVLRYDGTTWSEASHTQPSTST